MKFLKTLILSSVLLSFSVNALLEVNIIKSKEELFPVVIAPFQVIGDVQQGAEIANIIRDNLNRSGQFIALNTNELVTNQIDFNFWQEHRKDALIFVKIEQISSNVFNPVLDYIQYNLIRNELSSIHIQFCLHASISFFLDLSTENVPS